MFEIGFWEVFLIVVLALVLIGPERLPGAARTAGYWVGRIRRYIEGVRNEVEQEFDVSEFKRLMHNQEIQINELQRKLNDKLNEDALTPSDNDVLSKYDMHEESIERVEEKDDTSDVATDVEHQDEEKKDKPST